MKGRPITDNHSDSSKHGDKDGQDHPSKVDDDYLVSSLKKGF
jgi:hypothetical protein